MSTFGEQDRSPEIIRIRDANIEDAERIGQIAVNAWQFAYSSFLSPEFMAARADPAVRARRIRENWSQEAIRLVATSELGDVIGFAFEQRPCSVAGIDSEIGALYVDPNSSRAGAGKALVTEMARRFIQRGDRSMAIHTLAENRIGISFYRKIGGLDGPHTTWNDIPSRWFLWPDLRHTFCLED
jgi:ribosomal protein S18 acetylase RimI-like enzyme